MIKAEETKHLDLVVSEKHSREKTDFYLPFKVELKSSTLVTIVTSYGCKIKGGVVAQWGIIDL